MDEIQKDGIVNYILNWKMSKTEKSSKDKIERLADKILSKSPEYLTLKDAKKEMEQHNLINGDNYYHRLGMCRIGQMGGVGSVLSPRIGEALGWAKEAHDIYKKSIKGNAPWCDTLLDSFKDLNNNYESMDWGLKNPDKDCRIWLKDLDINSNTWRK